MIGPERNEVVHPTMEPKAKEDTTVSPDVRTHDNKIDVVGGSNDDGGGDLGTTGGTGEEGGGGGK